MNNYKPSAIENAIYDVLEPLTSAVGVPLVFAKQPDASDFTGTRAMVEIVSRNQQGQDFKGEIDDNGIMRRYGTRVGSGNLMLIGDNAGEALDQLVCLLNTQEASYAMTRAGMVLHSFQDIPMGSFQLDGAIWESSGVIDFQWRCGVAYDDNVGLIDVIDVSYEVNGTRADFTVTRGSP